MIVDEQMETGLILLAICLLVAIGIWLYSIFERYKNNRIREIATRIGFKVGSTDGLPKILSKLKLVKRGSGYRTYENILTGTRDGHEIVVFNHALYANGAYSYSETCAAIRIDNSSLPSLFIKRLGLLDISRMYMDDPDYVDLADEVSAKEAYAVISKDKESVKKFITNTLLDFLGELSGVNVIEIEGEWLVIYGEKATVSLRRIEEFIDIAINTYNRFMSNPRLG